MNINNKKISNAKLKDRERRQENISRISSEILISRMLEPYLWSEEEYLREIISTEKSVKRKNKPKKRKK
ncbi:MAG TPA: hypothetical protein PKE39_11725 [Ignavibacteria bacterium]|nr:hypothetical protein [Ignavibacteria bacterium]HMQ99683.1 hypothetical protein [Ignavibacteria bacterium]